jgi:type III secretion protein L
MGLAFLISTENLQLMSERKVLKQAEYAALLDATALVEAARAEAARIVTQAKHDAAKARDAGHAEGVRRAQAEQAQRLTTEALATQRQLQGLRSAMAAIVVKTVGRFMTEADPAALLEAALQRVDGLIRNEPFITMRIAPDQEAAVQRALARLGNAAEWPLKVAVTIDPALPAGACIVGTASGTLEIGLEAQLDAFRKAVEHGKVGSA